MLVLRQVALIAAAALACAAPRLALAQSEEDWEALAAEDAALAEMLDTQTTVAATRATALRDTPGVVTVVTREDIVRSGARDLVDVLHLVPGFSFGTDVVGTIGVGFRGIWAQEGKVLLLWDGQEMNELAYLTLQLGNRFPVHTIERIEIIRGPGSALYGGNAELAVINIVSRGAALDGVEGMAQLGYYTHEFARANAGISYGQRFEGGLVDGLELALDVFAGEGTTSDREYADGYGTRYRFGWDNAQSSPTWLNASARWQGLQVRLLGDLYRARQRDQYDYAYHEVAYNNFHSVFLDVKYDWKILDNLTLTPRVNLKHQIPWSTDTPLLEHVEFADRYSVMVHRYKSSLTLSWDIFDDVSVLVGGDGHVDRGEVLLSPTGEYDGGNSPWVNGEPVIYYWNAAAFAQLIFLSKLVNVTAGARYEFHSQAGHSFVPRVALTKTVDRLHGKLLLSGAFKPPGIENLNVNPLIAPERTRVVEGELGYRLLDNLQLTASVFDVEVEGPIVYFYDEETGGEGYENFPRTGSMGVEVDARLRDTWGYVFASYSLATAEGKNEVALYDTGVAGALRGMPMHKVAVAASVELTERLSLNPSMVFLSERYGWLGVDPVANAVGRAPPVALINVVVHYHDLLLDGLDGSAGIYNVLDADYRYLQPYDGGHAPLPAPSREVMGKLTYRYGL